MTSRVGIIGMAMSYCGVCWLVAGTWFAQDTLDSASAQAVKTNKIIFYVVFDSSLYLDYAGAELGQYLQNNVVVVQESSNPDSAIQKQLGIRGGLVFAGLDKYLNDTGLRLRELPAADKLINFGREVQAAARSVELTLRNASQKAAEYAGRGDEASEVRELVRIASTSKKGYPEIQAAKEKISEIAETDLKKARILLSRAETEKQGLAALDGIGRSFKGLPQGMSGELEAARHFSKKGEIGGAVERVNRVLRADPKICEAEIGRAQEILSQIVKDGIGQIRAALQAGVEGDLDAARERINKIKKDYAGTEVARHAADVLADIQK